MSKKSALSAKLKNHIPLSPQEWLEYQDHRDRWTKASQEISDFLINKAFPLLVSLQIEEDCDCCNGTGLETTDHYDDYSPCMNCNGSGKLRWGIRRK